MRGPGGDGVADVAVTTLPGRLEAAPPGSRRPGLVAALAAAALGGRRARGPPAFRCHLYALSLPAHVLAARLLGVEVGGAGGGGGGGGEG
jgi:hypothetical protein